MNEFAALLHEKLGLRAGSAVWIGGNDVDARREIEAVAGAFRAVPDAPITHAFVSPASEDEALYFATKLLARMQHGAVVWVSWSRSELAGAERMVGMLEGAGLAECVRTDLSREYIAIRFRPRELGGIGGSVSR